MVRVLTASRVFTGSTILVDGWVAVEGPSIVAVGSGPVSADFSAVPVRALGDVVLAPGFVDIHCHGGGGVAFGDGEDVVGQARVALATHRRHGTTTLVGSLVTDSLDGLAGSISALAPLVVSGELAGLHLEGPWLSPAQRGAHTPSLLRVPEPAEVAGILDAHPGVVVMVTLAPELPGGLEAVRVCARRGVVAAFGHSDASCEQVSAAIEAGVSNVTHLFNAMRPIHHREPGPIVPLLADERVTVELICDGVHVHPSVVAHAMRVAGPGRVVFVTDAMAATDMSDGRWELGGLAVDVRAGVARLVEGGAIAGSTLTMDRAVQFAVHEAGVELSDALAAATSTPAAVLGRTDVGVLAPGARRHGGVGRGCACSGGVERTRLGGVISVLIGDSGGKQSLLKDHMIASIVILEPIGPFSAQGAG